MAVTLSEEYKEDEWNMISAERIVVEKTNVIVLTSQHALRGRVAESFGKYDSRLSIVAKTLYCISQGIKAAIEIAIMAAEADIVPVGNRVISIEEPRWEQIRQFTYPCLCQGFQKVKNSGNTDKTKAGIDN